jgi:hypothetical protein
MPDSAPTLIGWESRLLWSIESGGIALRDYEWLFANRDTQQTLQHLVTEARQVLDIKNEARGHELEKEIDATLENSLKGMMILIHAEMICLNPRLEPSGHSQIRAQIEKLCGALRNNRSVPEVEVGVEQLYELILAVRRFGEQAPFVEDRGALLRRSGTLPSDPEGVVASSSKTRPK